MCQAVCAEQDGQTQCIARRAPGAVYLFARAPCAVTPRASILRLWHDEPEFRGLVDHLNPSTRDDPSANRCRRPCLVLWRWSLEVVRIPWYRRVVRFATPENDRQVLLQGDGQQGLLQHLLDTRRACPCEGWHTLKRSCLDRGRYALMKGEGWRVVTTAGFPRRVPCAAVVVLLRHGYQV